MGVNLYYVSMLCLILSCSGSLLGWVVGVEMIIYSFLVSTFYMSSVCGGFNVMFLSSLILCVLVIAIVLSLYVRLSRSIALQTVKCSSLGLW